MSTYCVFDTLLCDGYTYRLNDGIPEKLLEPVIGTVALIDGPLLHSYRCRTSLQILNSRLVLTELTCHLDEKDALRLLELYGNQGSLEYRKSIFLRSDSATCCALTIRGLSEAIPFTGKLQGRQIYVDEVVDGAFRNHDTNSDFCFIDGTLQADASAIFTDPTPFISGFTWSEALAKTVSRPGTLYYVDPIGTVRQQNMVISAVTWYLNNGWIDNNLLDNMLQDQHPVLRTEFKTPDKDGIYGTHICDLVEEAVKGLKLDELRKMAPYIAYDSYSDYPAKLLEAVLYNVKSADSTSLIDRIDALDILQRSGLQDPDGAAVLHCATELSKQIQKSEKISVEKQFFLCTTLCNMTSVEKVHWQIRSLLDAPLFPATFDSPI